MKRLFDVTMALAGLLLLWPLLLLVALLVKATSTGQVFFVQQRVGRDFRKFGILKFRTMVADAPKLGGAITIGNDLRITSIGRFLRTTKLDELPQLFNVLVGQMSLVGPRPEVPEYVEFFRNDYEYILQVRPGITDLASIKYRDEASILAQAENPQQEYVHRVLPEKIQLAKEYIARQSFWFDLKLIFLTMVSLFRNRSAQHKYGKSTS